MVAPVTTMTAAPMLMAPPVMAAPSAPIMTAPAIMAPPAMPMAMTTMPMAPTAVGGADLFSMLDRNHDGRITRSEFQKAF